MKRTLRAAGITALAILASLVLLAVITLAGNAAQAAALPKIAVTAGMDRNRPDIAVTMHVPACVTDPVVVARHDGRYLFWGYDGTIGRGHAVAMTLDLPPGTRGTWTVLAVDGQPCGDPDGQYSWPAYRIVRIG